MIRRLIWVIGFFLSFSALDNAVVGLSFWSYRSNNVKAQPKIGDVKAKIVPTSNPEHIVSAVRGRRFLLRNFLSLACFLMTPSHNSALSEARESKEELIKVPLISTGNEYVLYYIVDGSLFRAVLDTGSPFLSITGSCGENTRAKAGCYKKQGIPSGLSNTFERFDGFEGEVEWRKASFSFFNSTGSMNVPALVTFGVVDDDIMSGPGGVFFGLIKHTDSWIRPTFLGQTSVASFSIDLRDNREKYLTLSTNSLIKDDYIQITNALRKFGDPVQHYCSQAEALRFNTIDFSPKDGRPIFVIFDTGVTGMVISQNLFEQRYMEARERRERNIWGVVEATFRTAGGRTVSLSANKPLTTSFDPRSTWKRFKGHVIVVGLAFLDGSKFTVDIDEGRLWVEK